MRTIALSLAALLFACNASAFEYSWRKVDMDGHRTGVTVPMSDNVTEALGVISNGSYLSPNGTVFCSGAARKAAEVMIAVQPSMAPVKQVIGFSDSTMLRFKPECPLFDMISDCMREGVRDSLGVDVDVFFLNTGGVRVNMPQGNICVDDIMSMLPFNNRVCVVKLRGGDLLSIFEDNAKWCRLFFSGARTVQSGDTLESVLVGGNALDINAVYTVGTVDFLLEGGDGFSLARNALSLDSYDPRPYDFFLPYVRAFHEAGLPVAYQTDGRVTIK